MDYEKRKLDIDAINAISEMLKVIDAYPVNDENQSLARVTGIKKLTELVQAL